jgi:hypothetical protein
VGGLTVVVDPDSVRPASPGPRSTPLPAPAASHSINASPSLHKGMAAASRSSPLAAAKGRLPPAPLHQHATQNGAAQGGGQEARRYQRRTSDFFAETLGSLDHISLVGGGAMD